MRTKKALISLMAVLPLALSSCNSEKYIDLYNYDIDNGVNYVSVSGETLISMVNSEMEFFLFVHSDYCSHCLDADETFKEVMESEKYHNTVYMWEVETSTEYYSVSSQIPGVLNEEAVTPQFRIIQNGELITAIDPSRFYNNGRLKSTLRYYFEFASLYTLSLSSSFEQFNSDFDSYMMLVYDGASSESLNIYNSVYNEVKSKSTPTLFINLNQIENSLEQNLVSMGVDIEKDSLYYVENLTITKASYDLTKSTITDFVGLYN
ncbi:MAG: hypothetical protein LUC16_02475 [Coprobacillus sp.]|nr:hypothetical protein [Coprobacillus sp.]